MVLPAQVNHVSSQSIRTRSLPQVTRRTKKSKTAHENPKSESGMSRNAARERYRVQSLRTAFQSLQQCLPSVPPNTKLPKLDVLVLAASYISHLTRILSDHDSQLQDFNILPDDFDLIEGTLSTLADTETRSPSWEKSYLHPVKKWPMRSRLYAGVEKESSATTECGAFSTQQIIQWN